MLSITGWIADTNKSFSIDSSIVICDCSSKFRNCFAIGCVSSNSVTNLSECSTDVICYLSLLDKSIIALATDIT